MQPRLTKARLNLEVHANFHGTWEYTMLSFLGFSVVPSRMVS